MKFLLPLLLITVSCASNKPKNAFVETEEYQNRQSLTQSYYKEGETKLSENQIRDLLTKKQELPSNLKIAVARIGHESKLTSLLNMTSRRNLGLHITGENENMFTKLQGKDKRIKTMAVIPLNLMPANPDIRNLRDVAALMQANLLLILDTNSRTDSKFHIHKKNEVKATATIEAIIIDVLSGVITYTSVATNSAQIKEEKVFNKEELYQKVTFMAEDNALKEIFTGIDEYFN